MRVIYLDNNATTKVAPEAIEAMMPFLTELWGNPSSMHTFGGQVARHIDKARERMAALVNAPRASDIVITSGGTEGNNAAIRGALDASPDKRHIVTSVVEHPAVRTLCQTLAKRGYELTEIGVDGKGRLRLDKVKEAIRPDTAIVSIMWANNETGVIFPIAEIAKICEQKGVPFHTDAVQAAGKVPIDVSKLPINFLTVSGHKLHAPKGVGFLYIKRGTRFQPLIIGGHQERGKRAGTENVASIVGLGAASELASKFMDDENGRVCVMRDKLEKGILSSIKNAAVHGDTEDRLPNTTNIGFEYIEGEAILLLMSELGICASSGSACTSGSLEPSHVLRAMNVPFTRAHGSIRFSLSRYNTDDEITYTLEHMPKIIERLRAISPFHS